MKPRTMRLAQKAEPSKSPDSQVFRPFSSGLALPPLMVGTSGRSTLGDGR